MSEKEHINRKHHDLTLKCARIFELVSLSSPSASISFPMEAMASSRSTGNVSSSEDDILKQGVTIAIAWETSGVTNGTLDAMRL